MFSLDKFFGKGTKGTVLLKNGTNFSYHGPWKKVTQNTEVDRFLVNDFCAAEYTIVVDLSSSAKEIIKALVVAGPSEANVTIYGRSNLNQDLLTLTATVSDSTVTLIANAHTSSDSAELRGSKIIFSANYYQNQNIPVAGWNRFR